MGASFVCYITCKMGLDVMFVNVAGEDVVDVGVDELTAVILQVVARPPCPNCVGSCTRAKR